MYTPTSVRSTPKYLALALLITSCGSSHSTEDAGFSAHGDPCAPEEGCRSGLTCLSDDRFPGGYCTVPCPDGSCGDGATCAPEFSTPLCLATCGAPSDCRDGYQCWRGACRPECRNATDCGGDTAVCEAGLCSGAECTTDAECGPMQRCVANECEPLPPPEMDGATLLPTGTPCTADDECLEGVCLPAELGGVCSLPCTEPEDCFVFPSEAGCSALAEPGAPTVCVVGPPGGRSMAQPCTADDDCLARVCQGGVCSEVCSDVAQCTPGLECLELERAGAGGSTFMGCGWGDPRAVELLHVDYGRVDDIRPGFGPTLELATPPDAVSITLQAQQVGGPDRNVSFFSVTDPDGTRVFDVNELLMWNDQPVRWLPFDTYESGSMLAPNTTPDRVAFVPGLWQWSVGPIPESAGDTAETNYRLGAIIKRARGGVLPDAMSISLEIYIAPGLGMNASNADSNGKLQATLSQLETILGQAGVSVRRVRYHDVSGSRFSIIDSTDGSDSELAELFRQGRGGGRALDVFLVRAISTDGGGFAALGVAGGIPGPIDLHGTAHSGVVTAFDDMVVGSGSSGGRTVGHILAHEIGHYVGLFHSTERVRPCGPGEDPTTVECAPFGGGDQLDDTSRGDMGNLMFWSIVGSGSNTDLSPGQRLVYRLSALTGR